MRPTVTEQIYQAERILEQIVMPTVSEARAREMLHGVIDNLKMLGPAMPDLPGFLQWDNAAMRKLLGEFGVVLPTGAITDEMLVHGASYLAVAERSNEQLRDELSRFILGAAPDDARLLVIRAHLAERAARFPMRAIPPTPQAAKA